VGQAVFALGGAGLYATVSRTLEQGRVLARIRRGAGWLHPLGGLVITWIHLVNIVQVAIDAPMDWRGQAYVHLDKTGSVPSPGGAPAGDAT
jgi:hypothetical protein